MAYQNIHVPYVYTGTAERSYTCMCMELFVWVYSLITEFLSNNCKRIRHLGPKLELNNFILSNLIKSGTCGLHITSGACWQYITSGACCQYITSRAFCQYITSGACSLYITSGACCQYITSGACYLYITSGAYCLYITSGVYNYESLALLPD